MSDDAYVDYLESCYQGEIFGEAFMAAMAAERNDAAEVRKLRTLEQLEHETKELLARALRDAGRAADAHPDQVEQGRAIGGQLGRSDWKELMAAMRPELVRFVGEYREAEALAPAGQEGLVRHITAHEQALLDFVDAELAGAPEDSLTSVAKLLTP